MEQAKIRKAILVSAITLCFIVAGSRIYKFYQSLLPPVAEGTCVEFYEPQIGGDVEMRIIQNDNYKKESVVAASLSIAPGIKIEISARISYEELRSYKLKKVSCE